MDNKPPNFRELPCCDICQYYDSQMECCTRYDVVLHSLPVRAPIAIYKPSEHHVCDDYELNEIRLESIKKVRNGLQ